MFHQQPTHPAGQPPAPPRRIRLSLAVPGGAGSDPARAVSGVHPADDEALDAGALVIVGGYPTTGPEGTSLRRLVRRDGSASRYAVVALDPSLVPVAEAAVLRLVADLIRSDAQPGVARLM